MKTLPTLLLAALLPATAAFGQLIAIGQNTGVLTTFSAATSGQDLLITVDNTAAGVGGVTGSLTSFGFNTPFAAPLDLSKVGLSFNVLLGAGPTTNWNPLSTYDLNAGGFQANVDLGAESDENGNPNGNSVANGVEFGEIVVFKFSFDGAAYPLPDLDDIADLFNQNPDAFDFYVRWQEVAGSTVATSDAFGGDWPGGYDVPQGGPIPEPSTYGLVAVIGILALIGNRIPRRLRR